MKEQAKKTETEGPKRAFERKIKFSPFGVTSLRREDFEGERYGYWTGKTVPFDLTFRVEKCEMPNYLLQKVLPADVLDPPPREPKSRSAKRKPRVETNQSAQSPAAAKRQRITHATAAAPSTKSPRNQVTSRASLQPNRNHSTSWIDKLIELSDSEDELRPPPSRFESRSLARAVAPQFVDLGSPSPEEDRPKKTLCIASSSRTAQETPSRVAQHHSPFCMSDDFAEEDDDLRLALHLSGQEQITTSFKRSQVSTDAITRRPEAMSRGLISSTNQNIKQGQPTARATNAGLQIHSDDLSRGPFTRNGFSPNPQTKAAAPRELPGRTRLQDTSAVEDVRAARLRHFQQARNPMSSTVDTPEIMPHSHVTPKRAAEPKFRVPAGVNCIDLTDD